MKIDHKKRYWIFFIEDYYPTGGVHDVEKTTNSLRIARKYLNDCFYEVWDMDKRKEVLK